MEVSGRVAALFINHTRSPHILVLAFNCADDKSLRATNKVHSAAKAYYSKITTTCCTHSIIVDWSLGSESSCILN